MPAKPSILFIRVPDVPASVYDSWNHWYDHVHMESRMRMPHFVAGRRYKVLSGDPTWVALYDLTMVGAMTSDAYMQLRKQESAQPTGSFEKLGPSLPDFKRGVYEQVSGPAAKDVEAGADVIFVAGHEPASEDEARFNRWYDEEHAPRIAGLDGVVGLRRFELTRAPMTAASGGRSPHPRFLAIYYLASADVEALRPLQDEVAAGAPWNAQGSPVAILASCIYRTRAAG